jgi:hypothetical protein
LFEIPTYLGTGPANCTGSRTASFKHSSEFRTRRARTAKRDSSEAKLRSERDSQIVKRSVVQVDFIACLQSQSERSPETLKNWVPWVCEPETLTIVANSQRVTTPLAVDKLPFRPKRPKFEGYKMSRNPRRSLITQFDALEAQEIKRTCTSG